MHELSICQALFDQVNAIALQNNAQEVDLIVLRIGPLSGVDPDLLAQAFPLVAAGSKMEHAELRIEPQPISVRCETCNALSEAKPNRLICAKCGDYHTRLVSGDEMLLASVELTRESINTRERDKQEQEHNHV